MYTTTYDYDASGRLIHEYCIERYTYTGGGSHTRDITYLYDESGIVGAIQKYNSTEETFYFDKNIKGDVIALYNSSGTKVASYIYDAWGNCTISSTTNSTIANANPFRYRGYYYDSDLGMYYLQSRYYDASICRFISADAYVSTGQGIIGFNMFAYCGNNPVMGYDPTGHWDWGGVIIGAGIIAGTIYLAAKGLLFDPTTIAGCLATGGVMVYAAATDSQMVIDITGAQQSTIPFYGKSGGTILIDFNKDGNILIWSCRIWSWLFNWGFIFSWTCFKL